MTNILSLFDQLNTPLLPSNSKSGYIFIVSSLPDYPHIYLGKDTYGMPCILLSVIDNNSSKSSPSITLEHINVIFDVGCRVTKADSTNLEGIFTIIQCTSQDSLLYAYFLRIIKLLCELIPNKPTKKQISRAVNTFIELFRSITNSPRKSIQGLWAELFLISISPNPEILIEAWHTTPYDRFDFSMDNEKLEVKSTSHSTRQHHFSIEQVSPIEDTLILVASLFVERVNTGTTIIDLVDEIKLKTGNSPALCEHLDRIVITSLGSNWRLAYEDAFDKKIASNSLTYYDIKTIPAPTLPMPIGVSNVHFQSDLSLCQHIEIEDYKEAGTLFACLKKRTRR